MKFFDKLGLKNVVLVFAALGAAAVFHAITPFLYAATYDLWTVTGTGARRNTVEFNIQAPDTNGDAGASLLPGTDNINSLGSSSLAFLAMYAYDLTLSDDLTIADDLSLTSETSSRIIFGDGTSISTTNTSGHSVGVMEYAYMSGDTAAAEGSLLVATTVVVGQGIAVAVANGVSDNTGWVGISTGAFSVGNIAAYYTRGRVLALVAGVVNPGDVLISSTTRGYLGPDNTPTTGADVAVSLSSGPLAGALTKVQLR